MVYEGLFGSWRNWTIDRGTEPRGYFVTAAMVRFEDDQHGGDDTAMNGLYFESSYLGRYRMYDWDPDQ